MPKMRVTGYIHGLPSVIKKDAKDELYRVYVTDALKAIAENSTHFIVPGHGAVDYGSFLQTRWIDAINPEPEPEPDPRSCTEIATDIWKNIRGRRGTANERI